MPDRTSEERTVWDEVRLLLVEDDPNLAAALEQGLREQGYAVDRTENGQEGLDLAELEPYDLLVLDVMLPGMDGFEICRHLRKRGSSVPVLLLTARDSVEDRVRGLDIGADDYLVKPFSLAELLARCRALLRRSGTGAATPTLRAGALEYDPSSRRVAVNGRVVTLTHKETQLLEYFLRNPGRVLSREQIIAHVWDFDFVASSNVVDVYVRTLRRKLELPEVIGTVRGAGYQLPL